MAGTNGSSSRETNSGARKKNDADQAEVADINVHSGQSRNRNSRLTRIFLLQQAIAAGCYAIPAGAVAEKMLEKLLRESSETVKS